MSRFGDTAANAGGAISNLAPTVIRNSVFEGNAAPRGGAVSLEALGRSLDPFPLEVDNCVFTCAPSTELWEHCNGSGEVKFVAAACTFATAMLLWPFSQPRLTPQPPRHPFSYWTHAERVQDSARAAPLA